MHNENSIVGLVKELTHQSKAFIREEVQLAKTEISENLSSAGKDVAGMAIGGFIAYAGVIIFLGGIGVLLGFAFMRLGLEPLLAEFIGLGIIGLVVMGIGAGLLFGAKKALSKQTVAPKRTIETLQNLSGTQLASPPAVAEQKQEEHRSSEQIQASALALEQKMAETLEELSDRVTLKNARRQADIEIHAHPY